VITRPALVATAAAATLLLGACAGTPAALRPEAARAAAAPSGYLDASALEALALLKEPVR
jgi:acid phosphatase (class A)